jgi:Na+-transporting methylmalonyl-CoA/oxaloacetate decarboxylase gamma subunit
MTKFGKILVFVNLTFSLALMVWAMSAFIHRTDWSNNPAKDGQPEGELVKRQARARAAWVPLPDAERDWRLARQKIQVREETRRDTRHWYEIELAKLEKDANVKAPTGLMEVELDVVGQPVVNPALDPNPALKNAERLKMKVANSRQVDAMNKPVALAARNVYERQIAALFNGAEEVPEGFFAARTRHRKAVEDDVEVVTRMLGPKGLHSRLQDEKVKRENIVAEFNLVKPLYFKTAPDTQFALDISKDLRDRVEELETERNRLRRVLGVAGDAAAP